MKIHALLRIQAAGVRACLAPLLKVVEDRNDSLDRLWSPNVESRSMVAQNAMGKIVFR